MLRFGDVREADFDTARYRVYFPEDDVISFPLPLAAFSTQKAKPHTPLEVGTQVAVLMAEDCLSGVIIGAVYSEKIPPEQGQYADTFAVTFDGGGILSWDGETFVLRVNSVVVSIGDEGVRISKDGDSLRSVMSELLSAVASMTHTSATAGSPTSPPLNAPTFTALRQRAENILN
jgi:phage baseplate assembly protein gpV